MRQLGQMTAESRSPRPSLSFHLVPRGTRAQGWQGSRSRWKDNVSTNFGTEAQGPCVQLGDAILRSLQGPPCKERLKSEDAAMGSPRDRTDFITLQCVITTGHVEQLFLTLMY